MCGEGEDGGREDGGREDGGVCAEDSMLCVKYGSLERKKLFSLN